MRQIILHVHIFKNAGTTLDWTLKNNFKTGFVDHRDNDSLRQGKQRYLEEYLDLHSRIIAFSSHHLNFVARSNESFNYHHLYLIRHPIERIRSVYLFERKQPSHISLGAHAAKNKTFKEYVAWRMQENVPPSIRNMQARYFSGRPGMKDEGKLREALSKRLEEVKTVGIVDRYDESMTLFEAELRPFFNTIDMHYKKQNVTQKDSNPDVSKRIDAILYELEELAEIVLARNAIDIELYQSANQLLTERLIAGPSRTTLAGA